VKRIVPASIVEQFLDIATYKKFDHEFYPKSSIRGDYVVECMPKKTFDITIKKSKRLKKGIIDHIHHKNTIYAKEYRNFRKKKEAKIRRERMF